MPAAVKLHCCSLKQSGQSFTIFFISTNQKIHNLYSLLEYTYSKIQTSGCRLSVTAPLVSAEYILSLSSSSVTNNTAD